MSIEAMKQALEALEKLWDIIDDIDTYGDMAKSDDKLYRSLVERRQRQRFEQTGISTDGYELNGGAITALRQAIEQAEDKDADQWYENLLWGRQEPVACQHKRYSVDVREQTGTCYDCGAEGRMKFVVDDTPQPTAAQREWVGLTNEEIDDLWKTEYFHIVYELPRAIEAKLREKNT